MCVPVPWYVPWYVRTMVLLDNVLCVRTCVLVRIQAYMLADIVVAIPAVDLAIEAVV